MFATVIEANYITKKDDKTAVASLTDEDIRAIHHLSKDEKIGQRVSLITLTLPLLIIDIIIHVHVPHRSLGCQFSMLGQVWNR